MKNKKRRCFLCDEKGDDISYFSFPSEPKIRKKWVEFCEVDPSIITPNHRLCNKHFSSESYFQKKSKDGHSRLKRNAIPEIYTEECKQLRLRCDDSRRSSDRCKVCGNNSRIASYFRFPSDEETKKKWLKALGIREIPIEEDSSDIIHICSDHFIKNQDFIVYSGGKRSYLKKGAVPSVRSVLVSNSQSVVRNTSKNLERELHGSSTLFPDNQEIISEEIIVEVSEDHIDSYVQEYDNPSEDENEHTDENRKTRQQNITFSCSPRNGKHLPEASPEDILVPKRIKAINISHLETPARAQACLSFAKRVITQKNKKIKVLEQKSKRLEARIKKYTELIKQLEKQNLENLFV